MERTKVRSVLGKIKTVLTVAVTVFAVAVTVFILIAVSFFDRDKRSLFGYKMFIVLTDSMEATDFAAGDVIVVKKVDPATLLPGDIISFQSLNPDSYGETVTHKIRAMVEEENGLPAFITYGTTKDIDDIVHVTYPFVIGKYSFRLPKAGWFFDFLKKPQGYILCFCLPFLILIGLQGVNSVKLFRKYKKEQTDAIEEEQARINAERLESERMREELQRLRDEIARRDAASPEQSPKENRSGEDKK